MDTLGYYSLIQYCPNPLRMEAVNVGVVLFVAEPLFVKARVSANNKRVIRFFGRSFSNVWINAAKASIKERLKTIVDENGDRNQRYEDFKKFIATRNNELTLTFPKAIIVKNTKKSLDSLFKELVE